MLSSPIDDEELLFDLVQIIDQAISDEKISSSTFTKDFSIMPKLDILLSIPKEHIQNKVMHAISKLTLKSENNNELIKLEIHKKIASLLPTSDTEITRRVNFIILILVHHYSG